jgi:Methyltransferase domain
MTTHSDGKEQQTSYCCPLCREQGELFERAMVLSRFEANLVRCRVCASVWADKPTWLTEAYQESITESDVGLVARNLLIKQLIVWYSRLAHPGSNEPILDFGAGSGMLVRMVRDAGYPMLYFDAFGGNRFARSHEVDLTNRKQFSLVVASEVLEHFVSPRQDIEQLCAMSDDLLFTTELIPTSTPNTGDWAYFGFEHGQHIMFYSAEGLRRFAAEHNLFFGSVGSSHLLTTNRRRSVTFVLIAKALLLKTKFRFRTRHSLLGQDAEAARNVKPPTN